MLELIKSIFNAIISGDGTVAVVFVLIAVIAGLIFIIAKLWKDNKEKQNNFADIATEYTNNLLDIFKESSAQHQITADALRKIEVVLAEMKGKLK